MSKDVKSLRVWRAESLGLELTDFERRLRKTREVEKKLDLKVWRTILFGASSNVGGERESCNPGRIRETSLNNIDRD